MAQKEFRKPPRYMVGDIVYSHGFICIVCSIYPFNIDYSYDLKVIDGQSLGKIYQNDIMHVHIWEEFLKKNGWMLYHLYYWFVEKECLKLHLLEFDNYSWNACIGNNVIRINMCSVSDLQHLLFGLGLNSEMEV